MRPVETISDLDTTSLIPSQNKRSNKCYKWTLIVMISAIITTVIILSILISLDIIPNFFTSPDNDESEQPRIRREVRSLSYSEWEAIATAMNIMKNTSHEEGKLLYGDKFETYDSFVCRHFHVAVGYDGDQGHLAPAFFTFHRILSLQFEESLLSIDPTIESAPYWDFRLDTNTDLTNSVIFSDEYFGSISGDEFANYTLNDGKFANWKVNSNPNDKWGDLTCTDDKFIYRNPYGLLRGPWNFNDNPYMTRIGGSFCGAPFPFDLGSIELWDECIEHSKDVTELDECITFEVHAPAHLVIGGGIPLNHIPGNEVIPNPDCASWVLDGGSKPTESALYNRSNMLQKLGYLYSCFDCPWDNDDTYSCEIGVDKIEDCARCDLANVDGSCTINNVTWQISGGLEDQWITGDFFDIATSVNDPIFFFHHINLDRLYMEWQKKHFDDENANDDMKSAYYGYPTSDWPYGVNLDDVICGNNGCEFYDFLSEKLNGNKGPYTHSDILEATRLDDSIYTYDTIN